jgi:heme-degrading monooxygenase HmoA
MTIEVVQTYDLLPDADQQAYAELAKRTVAALLRAPGLGEIRANRNLLGTPQVRVTTVWERLGDWEAARESSELTALETESRRYMTNVRVEIWGPSHLLLEPVRPAR